MCFGDILTSFELDFYDRISANDIIQFQKGRK